LKVVLLADLRYGDLLDVVATEQSGLLLGGERSAGLAGHGLSRCRSYGGGEESHASAGAVHEEGHKEPEDHRCTRRKAV
jgi:hypothetical protein